MLSLLTYFGSGALSVKLLLVRNVENNKIDDYFRLGWEMLALPRRVREEFRIGPGRVRAIRRSFK